MKEYPSIVYFFRVFVTTLVIAPFTYLLTDLISTAWQSGSFSPADEYLQMIWFIFIFGIIFGSPGAIIFGIIAKLFIKSNLRHWMKKLLFIAIAIFLVLISYLIFVGMPYRGLIDGNIFVSYCIAVTAAILLVKLRAPEPEGLAD